MDLSPFLLWSAVAAAPRPRSFRDSTPEEESFHRLVRLRDCGALGPAMVAETVRGNLALGPQFMALGIVESELIELLGKLLSIVLIPTY
jgi:hypothetical protein